MWSHAMYQQLPGPRVASNNSRLGCCQQHCPETQHHAAHNTHRQRRCCKVTRCSSVREQKDPSRFASMDEAREYLMRSSSGPLPGIAGVLNFISNTLGAGRAGAHLGSWYRSCLSQGADQLHRSTGAAPLPAVPPEAVADLALIMLVSEHRVQKVAAAYPQVLSMPPAEVAARLVLLKELLPGSDVARMVELAPRLLLGASEAELHAAKQRVDVLEQHLPGADVAFMVQEDPSLMFEELAPSLPRMYELWPELDASTLAASDPKHLALALRALSDQGPPRRF